MVSIRCKMMVKEVLRNLGLHFIVVDLGEVEIMEIIQSTPLIKIEVRHIKEKEQNILQTCNTDNEIKDALQPLRIVHIRLMCRENRFAISQTRHQLTGKLA
jgi:FtsZ-binding cell division protein ZapB